MKVLTPNDIDGVSIVLEDNKLKANVGFPEVPEKHFVEGSMILAYDKDGLLYKFGQSTEPFYDVAISLTAIESQKLSDSTKFKIQLSITNTRDNIVKNVKAQIFADGIIENFTSSSSFTFGDNVVSLESLNAYEVFKGSFDITTSSNAYISTKLILDGDSVISNNNATIQISPIETPQITIPPNTYTQECPAVTFRYEGEELFQSAQSQYIVSNIDPYNPYFVNLIDQRDLNGASFNLEASSIRVFLRRVSNSDDYIVFSQKITDLSFRSWILGVGGYTEARPDEVSFSPGYPGSLTFHTNANSAIVLVRTGSDQCKWQVYVLAAGLATGRVEITETKPKVTGLDEQFYRYVDLTAPSYIKIESIQPIEASRHQTNKTGIRVEDTWNDYRLAMAIRNQNSSVTQASSRSKVIIELPRNREFRFNVNSYLPNQYGNITTSNNGDVVVSSDATSTDNIITEYVNIMIV